MDARLSAGATAIEVLFVLMPDSLILDWAGPAEALRIANLCLRKAGLPEAFRLRFVGPEPRTASSVGAWVSDIEALPSRLSSPCWVVLVGQTGERIAVHNPAAQTLMHWLRGLSPNSGRLELLTVCAGAVLAGHAGLLDNRRATTHHQHLEELRTAAPACAVESNRVFVVDGPVCSSAGVTTGIDLFLHRISALCGPALAAQVAQAMVVALRRGPNDPELSPFLRHRNHLHPALHRVQDAIGQQPQADWSLQRMAEVACTSARHLSRLFADHAGVAPLAYLRSIRLDLAESALRAGHSVARAAELAGFRSDTQLRRTWHQMGRRGRPSDLG
ncbi:MAG: helix-turn-helix domain-containing protein [Hydrogenophaga sp.]|jgi:transcriptional regulator GlxA family with amidase domain|nr:helix-turn-helix domain-containing protein [Hydrogenophaga sp.]